MPDYGISEKNEVGLRGTVEPIEVPEDCSSPDQLFHELIERIHRYHPSDDISMVEKAYKVAGEAHNGQLRKSGEPYIIHPLCVAIILAELQLDKESIVSGILHDVVEDTEITSTDMKNMFGGRGYGDHFHRYEEYVRGRSGGAGGRRNQADPVILVRR